MQLRSRVVMVAVVLGLLAGGAVRAVASSGEPPSRHPSPPSSVPAHPLWSPGPDAGTPTTTAAPMAASGSTRPPVPPTVPGPTTTAARVAPPAPKAATPVPGAAGGVSPAPAVRPATTTTRAPAPPPAPAAGNTAADALAALNRDRATQGLPALRVRADLQAKAQAWADKLAAERAVSHSNLSDGLAPCWTGLGENISPNGSVALAEQQLMNDPPHRANILNGTWNWVGVGVARTSTGVIVVQDFMSGCL